MMTKRLMTVAAVAVLAASTLMTACAPLLVGGAVGTGVVVATDRRTAGMQVEDRGIELRARSAIREALGDRGRVVVNSYNRRVLIVGAVATQADFDRVGRIVSQVENVNEIVNELLVSQNTLESSRALDTLITAKVRASFLDARDLSVNAVSVTTERGIVYLMGRVTQQEADRAGNIARTIPDVRQVVRVFEIISDEELSRIR
jgi:osmotically-inducible protein OsmY